MESKVSCNKKNKTQIKQRKQQKDRNTTIMKTTMVHLMAGIAIVLLFISPYFASGFTQSGASFFIGNGVPMGHEWLTRRSAIELLLGEDPLMPKDPNDPRLHWCIGLAKNTDISSPGAQEVVERIQSEPYSDKRYRSTYKAIYDAIMGERWVDLSGFNVTNSMMGKYNGFDAVAQEPAAIQYDHFMRRYDDRGPDGAIKTITESRKRFVECFVKAAMAKPINMKIWDGGGYSSRTEVNRNFFLFGKAMHLFQDSFSSEHSVRIGADNYQQVRQVKSYLCASGSEQHSHSDKSVLDYSSGDVIWKCGTGLNPGWSAYKPSHMKDVALVAMEASKDLWAAFIRTMGQPYDDREITARIEAQQLAANWLGYDEVEVRNWYNDPNNRGDTYVRDDRKKGKGQTVSKCMKAMGTASGSQTEKVQQLEKAQRIVIYNIISEPGYSDLFDPSLHMPFNWRWKNKWKWETPPDSWEIPELPADPGIRVRIKSVANSYYMTAPDGIGNNNLIYCKPGTPLEFILVGDKQKGFYIRLEKASLFLSYQATLGAVKLYTSPKQANFYLEEVEDGIYAIRSIKTNQYIWLSGESPYLSGKGSPKDKNSQWIIEGFHKEKEMKRD